MMKDFLNFRKEIYARSYSGANKEKRRNIEFLYDYLIKEEQRENSFKQELIDLICLFLFSPQSDFPIEPYITRFSHNAVYDNFFIRLIKTKESMANKIPLFLPREIEALTTSQFRSWLTLFQEMRPGSELIENTDVFFNHFIDDEYSLVLQLRLLIHYSDIMKRPVRASYLQLLMNTANSSFHSSGLMHYFKKAFDMINDSDPHSLIKVRESDGCRPFLHSVDLPDMTRLASLMKQKISFLNGKGILLFQFLFYGDPEYSGSGDSGGLGILLRDLGSSISTKSEIAGVITLCAYDTAQSEYPYVPITFFDGKHALVRLPIYLGGSGKEGFVPFERMIESELNLLMHNLQPVFNSSEPIFHIRYLDAASFVLSTIAGELDIPLVTTLTPDPHRRLTEGLVESVGGDIPEEQLNKFYRVLIGDFLLEKSSGVIGIGKNSIGSTLIPYFPQIMDKKGLVIEGIDEGINLNIKSKTYDLNENLCRENCPLFLKEENMHRPVILNIGRLNPAKGQINLLKAWDEYDLWKTHNLFLIGGNFSHPSSVEKIMINSIYRYVERRPYLKGKIRFQSSTANEEIRTIQNTISKSEMKKFPDVYLCSSIKEEFGISIIEAMSAGLIVMAPLLGGAKEYIHQGINGFLINTESSASMGREFVSYIYDLGLSEIQIKTIQKNAGQTIINKYSLDKIAEDFLKVYKRAGSRNE